MRTRTKATANGSANQARRATRLAALKEQWDPENIFSGNHNIAPRKA